MPGRQIIQWVVMAGLVLPFWVHASTPSLVAHYVCVLSTPPDTPGLSRQLEMLLRALRASEGTATAIMRDRARLRLAALYLRQARLEEGREQLRRIQAASPVAVTASLMMAESFRISGDTDAALQWYLRASEYFPYRPQTLWGLISAAHHLQQTGQDAFALALYNRTIEQAEGALAQLAALAGNNAPEILLSPDSPLSKPVRETLLQHALAHPRINLPQRSNALSNAALLLLQLNTEQAHLAQALGEMDELLAHYQIHSAAEQARLQALAAQRHSLHNQLAPDDFSDTQLALRRQITLLDNEHRRVQAALTFLAQALAQAPTLQEALRSQSHDALQRVRQRLQQHHAAVDEVMTQTLSAYRRQLQESSSEALLQQAEILRRHQ